MGQALPEKGALERVQGYLTPGDPVAARLYEQSHAARWGLTIDQFCAAVDASVAHAFPGPTPSGADADRYTASLHLDDLALAAACAAGLDAAWNHFVAQSRPVLYRAADAIDPTGRARDLADALYADLFGLRERNGVRRSLFVYFHGRSRLTTWLRAVLSQRYVDHVRSERGHLPIPDEDAAPIGLPAATQMNPDRPRLVEAMRAALHAAVSGLEARDRLRLRCYYAQDLTLAAIGRLLGEHEATVSRHLTRTRRAIREGVETDLRRNHGFDDRTMAECFRAAIDDPGLLDLAKMIGKHDERKNDEPDRSN